MAERASEVTELKRNLAQALRDKEQLQEVKQQQQQQQHTVNTIDLSARHDWNRAGFYYKCELRI